MIRNKTSVQEEILGEFQISLEDAENEESSWTIKVILDTRFNYWLEAMNMSAMQYSIWIDVFLKDPQELIHLQFLQKRDLEAGKAFRSKIARRTSTKFIGTDLLRPSFNLILKVKYLSIFW